MSFSTHALTVSYPRSAAPALIDLSLSVPQASVFVIIGPNGCGKSTLIRTLLGAIAPDAGEVFFEQRRVRDWPRAEFARRVGAVTQIEEAPFPISVRALVGMGRYPHLGPIRAERAEDRAAVEHAMRRCDVEQFADRAFQTLSGGERQRARIARALAQQAHALVLDEPTAALDIAHEMAVFELLRSLAHDEGHTVVMATHHINLAARYADTLLLLDRGRTVATGNPREVMSAAHVAQVYQWPVAVHHYHGAPQVTPLSRTFTDTL